MTELETAIWNAYNSDAALKAILTGGLHNTVAKQGTQEPYGIFQIISGVPRYTFSHTNEDFILQFRIRSKISDSSAELNNIREVLTNLYDNLVLALTGYTSNMMKRNVSTKSQDDDGIWVYMIQYTIEIQKD
jgi:hypothetical protein